MRRVACRAARRMARRRPLRVAWWISRDPLLFAEVGNVLLEEDRAPPPERLLIAEDAWALVEQPVAEALKPAAEKTKAVVSKTANVRVSPEGLADWFEVFRTLQAAEIWATLGAWVMQSKPQLGPGVMERFAYAA